MFFEGNEVKVLAYITMSIALLTIQFASDTRPIHYINFITEQKFSIFLLFFIVILCASFVSINIHHYP
ncbi:hypothetical protein HNP25_002724 [Arcicella rosea]|uniref:Uncharacterized protein n=1 Tax=Arcicella rosea TaxID=502909 RepID=A0A841EKI4_9BACT|nr:hypothetical protein [Arcicella rosea]